ncbi:PH domain-containing protein [Candidatus Peregrinibacteria bacterium]|nr:PH domain-containing protein [Candidatus Peregrinibacteria bacterium]
MFIANFVFRGSLEKAESIQYVLHKHPVTVHAQLMKVFIVGIVLPALFYYLFPPMKWLSLAWGIVGTLKLFYTAFDWYFDAWLITNKGIIVCSWNGFFDKEFSRVEYQTIEEVSYNMKGVMPTILGFGEITISRFGSPKPTTMKKALRPKRATKLILGCQEKFMQNKSRRDHEVLKNMLTEMLQTER